MEFYRQTSPYTGAAASLLMALHSKLPEKYDLTREQEFAIWIATVNLPTRSSSIYGLAKVVKSAGLNAALIVGEREYDYPDYRFKRYKKTEIDDAKFTSKLHADQALAAKVTIEEREFILEEVREHVEKGRLVLLRVNAGIFRERRATSKYVLVYGYDSEKSTYFVMDPEQGQLTVEQATMQEAFETLETKKKRDHRMLIIS